MTSAEEGAPKTVRNLTSHRGTEQSNCKERNHSLLWSVCGHKIHRLRHLHHKKIMVTGILNYAGSFGLLKLALLEHFLEQWYFVEEEQEIEILTQEITQVQKYVLGIGYKNI